MASIANPEVDTRWPPRGWKLAIALLVVAGLVLAGYLVIRGQLREQRGVENLPPAERAATFAARWESFESLCLPSARKGLEARCESDAKFLQRFPECGEECEARLAPHLPRGTK